MLLTGASGYIGSVVLEQLLRTTDVGTVYLLLRGRKGAEPRERVAALLQSMLFHLVGASVVVGCGACVLVLEQLLHTADVGMVCLLYCGAGTGQGPGNGWRRCCSPCFGIRAAAGQEEGRAPG